MGLFTVKPLGSWYWVSQLSMQFCVIIDFHFCNDSAATIEGKVVIPGNPLGVSNIKVTKSPFVVFIS